MKRLLLCLLVACTTESAPKPKHAVAPDPIPRPTPKAQPPIVSKMQALNEQLARLNDALHDGRLDEAQQAAEAVSAAAQLIDPVGDMREGYGDGFAALAGDLKSAAGAMVGAVKSPEAQKALRHLHDQCLRCHDQAPASAGAGVCQLTE